MAISDILISEASSALFEFNALNKAVIWCDFLKLHWNYRGIFMHRFEKRMDQTLVQYQDIALHAKKYKDLKDAVDSEINNPVRFYEKRINYNDELIGDCDGKVSEKITICLVTHQA